MGRIRFGSSQNRVNVPKSLTGKAAGFQTYGGKKTGQVRTPLDKNDIVTLQWVADALAKHKELSVPAFDSAFSPIGSVYRYDLRHKQLIMEYSREGYDWKFIGVTPKGGVLLKHAQIYIDRLEKGESIGPIK